MALSHNRLHFFHLVYLALRSIQTLLTLTVLILYATTLSRNPQDLSSYIYALICSTLTLLTLAIYSLPKFPTLKFFLWEFVLAVLWAALAGVFGMIYLERGDQRIQDMEMRMKGAVACDLVVMVCWVVTAVWGCLACCNNALAARRARREQQEADKMLDGQERGVVQMEQDSDGDCEKRLMGGEDARKVRQMLKGRTEKS